MRSGKPVATDTDCIALAVALFQAPSQFPDLLHGRGELPYGVSRLLLIASGNTILEGEYRLAPFLKPEEIREAATFFIQQVLLAKEADHYRVLGVTPGAPIDDIKENHRLLMRLFHPDRHLGPDAEAAATATRVNQAYNVLRSESTRAAYDLTLEAQRHVSRKTAPAARARLRPEHRQSTFTMPPFVARHLTPIAVGSVAMIASLSVLAVYLNRPTTGAIGAGERGYSRAATAEVAMPTRLPDSIAPGIRELAATPAAAESAPPAPAVISAPVAVTAAPPSPSAAAPEMPVQAVPRLAARDPSGPDIAGQIASAPAVHEEAAKPTPVVKVGNLAVAGSNAIAKQAVAAGTVNKHPPADAAHAYAMPPQSAPAVPVAPPPVVQPEPPPKVPAVRPEQLNRLVANFAQRYQDGDLDNLLELFDRGARIERGDKRQIRNEYSELFKTTDNRTLYIWDVAWSPRGEVMRGEGRFQARVLPKGDSSPRIYDGAITIEAIEVENKPLIVGLFHKTN